MTIAIVNKTTGFDGTPTTVNPTASVAKTLDRIYLVGVGMTTNTSVSPVVPTVSGTGITQVASVTNLFTGTGSTRRRLSLLLALGTAGSSNVININCSTAPTRIAWVVDEATDVDTTTPNVVSNDATVAGSSAASVLFEMSAMNALQNVDDRLYMLAMGNTNAVTMRPELDADKAGSTNSKDWTALGRADMSSAPVFSIISGWLNNATVDLTPGYLNNDGQTMGMLAVELKKFIAQALPYWGVSAN